MSIFGTPQNPDHALKILENSKKLFSKGLLKREYLEAIAEHLNDSPDVWTEELLTELTAFVSERRAEFAVLDAKAKAEAQALEESKAEAEAEAQALEEVTASEAEEVADAAS